MSKISKISTGQPNTLKTYRGIAYAIDGFKEGKAVKFIDEKIKQYPGGEDEEVILEERQMLALLSSISKREN